jgi:hypothetical protein
VKHTLSDARSSMSGDGVRGYCYQGSVEVGAWPGRKLHGFHQDPRRLNIFRYIQNIFIFNLVNMNTIQYKYDMGPEHWIRYAIWRTVFIFGQH